MAWKKTMLTVLRIVGCLLLFAVILDMNTCAVSSGRASFFWNPLIEICISPRYSKVMEVPVESNGKTVPCSIYRRDGSPFLLVGPYPFQEQQSDFFFVAKDFVQARFPDEKTDDWTRIFNWVWVMQDMDPNGWDSYAPYYSFKETRVLDPKTDNIVFTLTNRDEYEDAHYSFSIPKRLIDALPEYCEKKADE